MALLDETSGMPLYHQLREIMYGKIMSGEWALGSQVPTEEELVAEYKVSRSTVRSAIGELMRQGILNRKRGVGTFVVAINMNGYFIRDQFYPDKLDGTHENLAIATVQPGAEVAGLLRIDRSKPVFEFLRLMGKEPLIVIEKIYIDRSLCPDLAEDPPKGTFYEWLGKKHNIQVLDWETQLEAACLSEEEARLVGLQPGNPALLYKRLNIGTHGLPVYFSQSLFRGDRFCMSSSSAAQDWITKIRQ